MSIAHSKITIQGQTSIPLEVRKKLGVGPGSILERDESGGTVIVRRAGRYTSGDVHRAVFPEGVPAAKPLDELKRGIRERTRKRHARD